MVKAVKAAVVTVSEENRGQAMETGHHNAAEIDYELEDYH